MAKVKKEKKERTTLQTYKSLKRGRIALEAGKYAMPLIPAGVMTGVNWEVWFKNCGASLPFGFTTLIFAVVLSILGISKKDNLVKEKLSGLVYLALTFACFGLAFKFLSNIMNQMGDVFLWTALAICGSFGVDQVDKTVMDKNIAFYKDLVDKNELDPRAKKKRLKEEALAEKAKKEAEQAKNEKVDML